MFSSECGFDMVPRLSSGAEEQQTWDDFIDHVKVAYKDDSKVKIKANYIQIEVGDQLLLPFEGHKFLRFSSKPSDDSDPYPYIYIITGIACDYFGFRARSWQHSHREFGYYSQNEVNESFRLYEQPDPPSSINVPLFEVRDISGKGRGLIAKVDIPAGTRILCEKPLLQASTMNSGDLEATAAPRVKALSESQQREFLSLHNNFPGEHPFSGIIRTNALPCGPGSIVGGVYPTISLINHSCLANSHNNWNSEAGHETIHAIRPIKAGEEITISYDEGGPSNVRKPMLKQSFGFDCACSLCSLPPSQLQASDDRRVRIQQLNANIRNAFTMMSNPEDSLKDCLSLLHTLQEEYGVCAVPHNARLYYDAFQICIAHGDEGRSITFAERSYEARVTCEGVDSPEALRMMSFVLEPETHSSFGALSMRWKTRNGAAFSCYGHYGTVEAEKRLFRQDF
ncbi:SET domain containing protein 5 [Fusarium agapanthi]|uniref:SET domain containing protein 5 n=1 Tax=Fusarium agapanthi TaxID=1803897 RepID=A0A9P5B274_9HYPO|nr:SET domain containing protein 5 [Fusarium agapanthi]